MAAARDTTTGTIVEEAMAGEVEEVALAEAVGATTARRLDWMGPILEAQGRRVGWTLITTGTGATTDRLVAVEAIEMVRPPTKDSGVLTFDGAVRKALPTLDGENT